MTELHVPPITPDVLAAFATASGDDNPLHRDLEAARAAGLGQVPVHGMLSMAYLARLATTVRPQEDLVSLSVRFVATTPLGSAPTFRATPVDEDHDALEGRLDNGTVTVRGTARYRPSGD
jgi:acyl dehydratase